VDLERRCRLDLLPDRTAETLAAWLAAHPGVEVVSRDRGGAYAQGTRQGAPEAEQVADRFHLLRNLNDALERHLLHHRAALRQAAATRAEAEVSDAVEGQQEVPEPSPRRTRKGQEKDERRARRLARYEEVRAMRERGMSIQAICRALGLARRTVRTFLRVDEYPERAPRTCRPGILAPYEGYLRTRLTAGCENGQELWRELRARGYTGSASPVYAWLVSHRTQPATRGRPRLRGHPAGLAMPKTLSPRQGAWLLQRPQTDLDDEERTTLEQLCGQSEGVATAHQLAQEFGRLVRERDRVAFDLWLRRVEQSGLAELQSFAIGLCQDRAAVEAALSSEASNGQTEGQINRLKTIKRQMYGRAKFDLLRQRVLHAA
jgi:transposase